MSVDFVQLSRSIPAVPELPEGAPKAMATRHSALTKKHAEILEDAAHIEGLKSQLRSDSIEDLAGSGKDLPMISGGHLQKCSDYLIELKLFTGEVAEHLGEVYRNLPTLNGVLESVAERMRSIGFQVKRNDNFVYGPPTGQVNCGFNGVVRSHPDVLKRNAAENELRGDVQSCREIRLKIESVEREYAAATDNLRNRLLAAI